MKLLSSNFLRYYTVYYTVQCGSSSLQYLLLVFYFLVCGWNPIVWPFKWKLLSSTFLRYWVVLSCCAQPWICPFSLKVAAYNLDTFEWRSALGKSEKSTSSCGLFSYNCTACSTFQYHWSYIILFLSFSKGQLSGGDGVSYDFNMASLADHLKKQSEQGSSTYYNIDIIKYEVSVSWQEVKFF